MVDKMRVSDGTEVLVVEYECCRKWPIALLTPVGKCGLCGKKPTPAKKGGGNG